MQTANTPALLLIDLPSSAFAGIDLLSFTVTPKFRGVKNLPSGFHFAFAGTSTAFSERHGLWFHVAPKPPSTQESPLFIARWLAETETLEAETDEAEQLRWRANLGSVWREGLTPYRQTTAGDAEAKEELSDWPSLTSCISAALLSRITAGDAHAWRLTSASSARRDLETIPGLDSDDKARLQVDGELHLLPLDLVQTWREGATGRERTEAAQDRSWALQHVVDEHCSGQDANEVIGELQFCFLMVLTINNFSCLEQWRRLLTLLFTCKQAVSTHSRFFVSVIAALRLQLRHCKDAEGGLIDLADEGGSLLRTLLARFRKGLESSAGSTGLSDVMDELDDLEGYLRKDHGWEFGGDFARSGVLELEDGERVQMDSHAFDEDDETGEFAPQIVELTPDQARLLGVTPDDARELGLRLEKTGLVDSDKVARVVQDSDDDDDNGTDDEADKDEQCEQDLNEMDLRF